jgi:hypothetical protein
MSNSTIFSPSQLPKSPSSSSHARGSGWSVILVCTTLWPSATRRCCAFTHKSTPELKLVMPPSDLKTFSNQLPFQILGFTLKRFAKLCDICDASRGSLSSYAYILMAIYFLQQCNPPVIPVLQEVHFNLNHVR